jgi:excisionase family DNA binding protein
MPVDASQRVHYLLRPAEVAQMPGVSRSWLYAAVQSGRIPSLRLGGADGPVRFQQRELDTWIAESRAVPSPVDQQNAERPPRDEPVDLPVRRRNQGKADAAQLRLIPLAEL